MTDNNMQAVAAKMGARASHVGPMVSKRTKFIALPTRMFFWEKAAATSTKNLASGAEL
jgi:protocatechuate 3,4-dioxygenase beta subunit